MFLKSCHKPVTGITSWSKALVVSADFPDYINTCFCFFFSWKRACWRTATVIQQFSYCINYLIHQRLYFKCLKGLKVPVVYLLTLQVRKWDWKKASGGKVMIYLGKTQIYLSKQHSITTHICSGIFKGEFVVTLYEGMLNLTDICISVIREQHTSPKSFFFFNY